MGKKSFEASAAANGSSIDEPMARAISRAGGLEALADKTLWEPAYLSQLVQDPGDTNYPDLAISVERETGITCEELGPSRLWIRDSSGVIGYVTPVNLTDKNYLRASLRNQFVEALDPTSLIVDAGATEMSTFGIADFALSPNQTVSDLLDEALSLFDLVMGMWCQQGIQTEDHYSQAMARLTSLAQLCVQGAFNALETESARLRGEVS